MRWVSTRVLPLPGPAIIRMGPWTSCTAACWAGLSMASRRLGSGAGGASVMMDRAAWAGSVTGRLLWWIGYVQLYQMGAECASRAGTCYNDHRNPDQQRSLYINGNHADHT